MCLLTAFSKSLGLNNVSSLLIYQLRVGNFDESVLEGPLFFMFGCFHKNLQFEFLQYKTAIISIFASRICGFFYKRKFEFPYIKPRLGQIFHRTWDFPLRALFGGIDLVGVLFVSASALSLVKRREFPLSLHVILRLHGNNKNRKIKLTYCF